jgi:hypothetical protein
VKRGKTTSGELEVGGKLWQGPLDVSECMAASKGGKVVYDFVVEIQKSRWRL